ncbi:class II histocompatibility antigen, B-L beta chain-like isoform X1 [Colossoma macropomum]|uniref:class II histocompatibility antigen, B-L beta chain-like isoform X1 n=1 Tax=Colossoma macropomum TaxID=42526 RepID=UPI001864CB24|nr:class II histocompatibility antigen, B-L beta chain-like isoform X1 [Colossoma macropomum]
MNWNSLSETLSVVTECRDTMIRILQLLLTLTLSIRTDGYYTYTTDECITSSPDLSDAEFIRTTYFNKDPVARFNSTVGEYVGFTALGVKNAERFNKGPEVAQMRAELERYCKPNLQIDYSNVLEKTVKPRVKLVSEKPGNGGHPAMLMCSAYGFYPPAIDVYWLKDGKKVTHAVTSTAEMADGDWYYQIHSHLEYTPTSGEKISCVVDHASSKEPIIYNWDGSLPESEKNKIAIGASGLVLGIILSAAGFIYYKKKSSGRILVPS